MARKVKLGKKWWRIVGVNGDIESKIDDMRSWMENKEEKTKTVIGSDFNTRTGELGREVKGKKEKENRKRKSKDKKINEERKKMLR